MYRSSCQRGFLTVFFSVGSKPLDMWEVHTQNGHIARLLDPDIKSMVLDIRGTNVSTSYIECPSNNRILGIAMPFMIMLVKNLKKYFTFEVTIMDDSGVRRRFRVSNFQSSTQIMPLSTAMPILLADGWNQIQFNLSEFTRRAYNKTFIEVQKIKINANIRLRRIYFAERLTAEEDLPHEYRILFPIIYKDKGNKGKKASIAAARESKTNVSRTAFQPIPPDREQSKIKSTSAASIVEIPLAENEPITSEAALVGVQEVEASNQEGKAVPEGNEASPEADETTPGKGVSDEAVPENSPSEHEREGGKTPPTEHEEKGGGTPPTEHEEKGGGTPPTEHEEKRGGTPPTEHEEKGGGTPPTEHEEKSGGTPAAEHEEEGGGREIEGVGSRLKTIPEE